MASDDKGAERRLKAYDEARNAQSGGADGGDSTHLFEEFKRPPQPGEPPKPRGLNAMGYQFPPTPGPAPMTKENLAKGVGLPPSGNIVPSVPPPTELVQADPLFEEYQRPDLKHKPRTGQGLRTGTMPKTAKEILQGYEPPTPQVFTPRRDGTAQAARSEPAPRADPPATPAPATTSHAMPPATLPPPAPTHHVPRPATAPAATPEVDAAHLDAEADLASAPSLTMSHSKDHGPTRTVTDRDPFAEMPDLPGRARAPARQHSPAPHVNDAPPVEPGDGPRIALVQADFNYGITTRMAQSVRDTAGALGCDLLLHVHVGGVFDLPLVAKALAARQDVDAVVAVGCVIQGETGHDELIARECARKLADLSYETGKPVGLAVTGPRMTRQAAEARAVAAPRHAVESVVKQWRTLKAIGAARLAAR